MAFKPINGKLPPIQVPWPKGSLPPSNSDLHMVEVSSWNADRQPRGTYVESLKMHERSSDASILEPVQISMNCCDWERSHVQQSLQGLPADVFEHVDSSSRKDLRASCLAVGIQHSGLPTSVLVSCTVGVCVHVHVLDVNAYLEHPKMQEVAELVRRRAVGAWFLNHEDKPLDARLPLFPPDIEQQLTFSNGSQRCAVSFRFPMLEQQSLDLDNVDVSETVVRCGAVLTPDAAGSMILGKTDGGEIGKLLRHLADCAWSFEDDEKARESLGAFEHLDIDFTGKARDGDAPDAFAPLASCRMMRALMHMVDRHVGGCLEGQGCQAWRDLLRSPEQLPPLRVKYSHGRPDPSTWKVMQRLLRLKTSDGSGISVGDALRSLSDILKQPGLSYLQQHCFQSSFIRRLRNTFPSAYYEVVPMTTDILEAESAPASSFFHHDPVFHVTSPLQRNLDILGMRALKCHLGLTPPADYMLLTKEELQETVARANARTSAQHFGMHIFRVISWMKELSVGRQVSDALIGAVGPSYINVLMPSACAHILELKVPVAALSGDSYASDYDVNMQSLRFTARAALTDQSLIICTWYRPEMVCTVARNCAQPIPHHAAAHSVLVTDLKFQMGQEAQAIVFPVGQRMFPEMFSTCPDLTEWAVMDRRLEKYAELWTRVRTCQVHAAAVNGASYISPARAQCLKWHRPEKVWYLECRVEMLLDTATWLDEEDLAVMSFITQDRVLELRGEIVQVKTAGRPHSDAGSAQTRSLHIEVKMSDICHALRETHANFIHAARDFRLYFISVPGNEKKSIRMLRAIPKTPLLLGMPLTSTRTAKQQRRELEMRPLLTVAQVDRALKKPEYGLKSVRSPNDKQLQALKRGLQMPFSMVQGPPGTGKTSSLVRYVVSALSSMCGKDRILVCAPSNQAADHLLERLVQDTHIPAHYITRVYSRSIEQENGSTYNCTFRAERRFDIQSHLEEHALHYKVSQAPKMFSSQAAGSQDQRMLKSGHNTAEEKTLQQSRIVITTCTNSYLHTALSGREQHGRERPVSYHTVVIDEAAQASEPDVYLASTLASHRIVVVGDHQQLGPVVPEQNLCAAYVIALETPFLERMMQNPRRARMSTMLDVQYRMHASIRSFPSAQFYESKLLDGVSMDFRPKLGCLWPKENEHRLFVDCKTPQTKDRNMASHSAHSMTSLKNCGEAAVATEVCAALLRMGCSVADIAVITPYTSQQHEIRTRLGQEIGQERCKNILVGTVHAVQGSEKEYIILSFVRSLSEEIQDISRCAETFSKGDSVALRELRTQNLGIVSNRKLLNVALTRAKYGLVCIGNAEVLSSGSKDFLDLVTSLKICRCLVDREDLLKRLRQRRWARRPQPSDAVAASTIILPEDSASNLGTYSQVASDDANRTCGSEVSGPLSSISVLSEPRQGPKCFLRGTLLPAASGMKIPVEYIGPDSLVCRAGSSEHLRVIDVQRHDNTSAELVRIATEGTQIVVTSTHRIVMEGGEKRQADQVREGERVQITAGAAPALSLATCYTSTSFQTELRVALKLRSVLWSGSRPVWTSSKSSFILMSRWRRTGPFRALPIAWSHGSIDSVGRILHAPAISKPETPRFHATPSCRRLYFGAKTCRPSGLHRTKSGRAAIHWTHNGLHATAKPKARARARPGQQYLAQAVLSCAVTSVAILVQVIRLTYLIKVY